MGKSARLTLVLCLVSCSSETSHQPWELRRIEAPPSQGLVQRGPEVSISQPMLSRRFEEIEVPAVAPPVREFEPPEIELPIISSGVPDPVVQSFVIGPRFPVTSRNFLGQGTTLGGCVFPRPDGGEPAGCTSGGDPPDPVMSVGPNHVVQTVNTGVGVWNKSGTLVMTPRATNLLWSGFPSTDGNACATANWGDATVLYDQLADRWFITQFDITNGINSNTGPSYQCVAVSQTADPTGAYYLYDFRYTPAINDQAKFSIWPDAYYATFNMFTGASFTGADVCAYDREKMLQGMPATQQCFQQGATVFGLMPSNLDGPIKPPKGEPAFFVGLGTSVSIRLYAFHVDWTTPANSTFTGPTTLSVASYTQLCGSTGCVTQPSPGNTLAGLGDRAMFRLAYRNFGTHESLIFNHTVSANGTGGPRWYEIRSPNATPTLFQQGTFAPNDGKYRWMGSMAQDQAQDIALGYSLSGITQMPAIAWTGRVATDALGQMGQGESIVQAGGGVETGNFSSGQTANRWGDYTSMWVDPSDDCTFWYTNELYPANGIFNWDTRIASVKFPNCAANNFATSVSPLTNSVVPGGMVTYTVSTTSTAGTAESIALNIQDLPSGVTGAFNPATVTAGASSTLTLTATASAPLTGTPAPTFTVIGKANSAVHAASAQVAVVATLPPDAAVPDAPTIDAPVVVDAPVIDAAEIDAVGTDGAGGTGGTGGSGGAGGTGGSGGTGGTGGAGGSGGTGGSSGTSGTGGTNGASQDSGGCGCSTHGSPRDVSLLSILALVGVLLRRRR